MLVPVLNTILFLLGRLLLFSFFVFLFVFFYANDFEDFLAYFIDIFYE